MTRLLTLANLHEATGGRLVWDKGGNPSDLSFPKVVYDSREVEPGSLFAALPGENSDGHNFISGALANGAAALLVSEEWLESQAELPEVPCVAVPRTLAALQQVAGWWRAQLPELQVTGITGSVGKTSTKELTAAVLSQHFPVFKSYKSFNNEHSLMPLILQLQPEHRQAVIEMGCGWELGELRRICAVARPQIGVILGVSHSHLARMRTLENIAKAKAELIESLPPEGWAVLNGDDTRVRAMSNLTPARPFFYGSDPSFDLWADEIETFGLDGVAFTAHYRGEARRLRLPLRGRHSVQTALAASAVGLLCGLDWEQIEAGLKDPEAQTRIMVRSGPNGARLLDDCYNASPVSTLAALELIADTPVQGQKLALLGDMLELGEYTEEGHRLVGRRAAQVLDQLIVAGELGQIIGLEALDHGLDKRRVYFARDKADAAEFLLNNLQAGDLLLVKASRGIALEDVIACLTTAC